MKRYDLTGKSFGRLNVIMYDHTDKWKNAQWLCKCVCGNQLTVSTHDLVKGHTKSCGCLQKEKASEAKSKHGQSESRLYAIYKNMKARCLNVNNRYYKNYGGRGITVCDEWKNSFESFYDWAMDNGYREDLTIDRIDVNGNYEPSNCRWATMKQQNRNRRNSRMIESNGEMKTLQEWSEILGMTRTTLSRRLSAGYTINDIRKGIEHDEIKRISAADQEA